MADTIIRIQSIELENFKNIQKGIIDLTSYRQKSYYTGKSDIIGIYGQNGSGKTAVVEAYRLFKIIASGEKIPDDIQNYIYELEDTAKLKFVFYIEKTNYKFLVYYEFSIRRKNNNQAEIVNEKLSSSEILENTKKHKYDIVEYDIDYIGSPILPIARYKELIKQNKENDVNLKVIKKLTRERRRSFIFNDDLIELFHQHPNELGYDIISSIKHFAVINLFVITTRNPSPISLNLIPSNYRLENSNDYISIKLLDSSIIDRNRYNLVLTIIEQINIVLTTIIPHLHLEVVDLGNELSHSGDKLLKFELLSVKNEIRIPLKYESEGIIKIISILSTLISMYNNPSICLIVDELDSGIFEYLLGELLKIIEQKGKGQFLFTSHNLRALEMLDKDSLVFSTTNSRNRFIRIRNIKMNNNLRNVYLRGIDLGGLSESIYEETNSFEIAHAFRKAGEFFE
ncbi:MAG: hypothetical protein K0R15_874 [Clostridiales bacterium]|jgi:AAA15 family ATPase/GTPase|nr:hypothetical protein [Clostridiales bacterium]